MAAPLPTEYTQTSRSAAAVSAPMPAQGYIDPARGHSFAPSGASTGYAEPIRAINPPPPGYIQPAAPHGANILVPPQCAPPAMGQPAMPAMNPKQYKKAYKRMDKHQRKAYKKAYKAQKHSYKHSYKPG